MAAVGESIGGGLGFVTLSGNAGVMAAAPAFQKI
jgi:hypothetical protein